MKQKNPGISGTYYSTRRLRRHSGDKLDLNDLVPAVNSYICATCNDMVLTLPYMFALPRVDAYSNMSKRVSQAGTCYSEHAR